MSECDRDELGSITCLYAKVQTCMHADLQCFWHMQITSNMIEI